MQKKTTAGICAGLFYERGADITQYDTEDCHIYCKLLH